MTRDDDELDLLFAPREASRDAPKQRSVKGVHPAFAKRSSAYAMQLFDKTDVQLKLESAKRQRDSEELQSCLRKMQSTGGMAFLVPQPEKFETILDGLLKRYPHFHNVIDFLRLRMRLNALNAYPVLDFGASILLDGPAGCGKTSFLAELSRSFETKFVSISCAAATNSFDLSGLSAGWANGRAGMLFETMVSQLCPNPIIMLDEIDKCNNGGERQHFIGALYGLLEKSSAKSFRDEFIGVTMDASRVNWFATSNDASALDSPIRDRFEVVSVRAPNKDDLAKIIPQLLKSTVVDMELQDVFSTAIKKEVLNKLLLCNDVSIRRIQSIIKTGLANAATRVKKGGSKVSLRVSDIPDYHSEAVKQKIGFIH